MLQCLNATGKFCIVYAMPCNAILKCRYYKEENTITIFNQKTVNIKIINYLDVIAEQPACEEANNFLAKTP